MHSKPRSPRQREGRDSRCCLTRAQMEPGGGRSCWSAQAAESRSSRAGSLFRAWSSRHGFTRGPAPSSGLLPARCFTFARPTRPTERLRFPTWSFWSGPMACGPTTRPAPAWSLWVSPSATSCSTRSLRSTSRTSTTSRPGMARSLWTSRRNQPRGPKRRWPRTIQPVATEPVRRRGAVASRRKMARPRPAGKDAWPAARSRAAARGWVMAMATASRPRTSSGLQARDHRATPRRPEQALRQQVLREGGSRGAWGALLVLSPARVSANQDPEGRGEAWGPAGNPHPVPALGPVTHWAAPARSVP